jgi:hypothetical protein
MARHDPLKTYRDERSADRTPEPFSSGASETGRAYVIQKHAARRLHYDFRLEHNGALLSWAVPNGPSRNPADKQLAVPSRIIRSSTSTGFGGQSPMALPREDMVVVCNAWNILPGRPSLPRARILARILAGRPPQDTSAR